MLSFTCFQKYVWSKHKIRLTNTGFVWPSISWKLYIKTSPEKQNFKLNNVKKKKKKSQDNKFKHIKNLYSNHYSIWVLSNKGLIKGTIFLITWYSVLKYVNLPK